MNARAYVTHAFHHDAVDVYLGVDNLDGRRSVFQPVELVAGVVESNAAVPDHGPTMRLPEPVARALLDALAAHFGGTGEVQTLRKDYLAERARVDKMIDYLTGRQR